MSQRLIDRVRAKFPQYADVPDDRLTLAIGEKYPQYLEQDGNFARTFDAYRQMRLNDADTAARTSLAGHVGAAVESGMENFVGAAQAVDRELIAPLTGGTVDQWVSAVPEAASLMLRQPVREAGKVFSAAGRLLAEDVGNVTRLTGLDPAGPVAKGLQDVGETAPVLAASMGLQRLGVNPAVAFGAPPAVQTYGETGDVAATLKAGATGALIPAVAQVGKLGGAALNRALIERNLLSPAANATQKAVEVLGSQGAVQVFMEGLRLPEYAALDPEARREAIYRNLVANTAFLAMDLPTFKRSVPSETLLRMAPAERVAYGLRDAANNPELVDALQRTADELARQATLPDAAQVEGEGPLFRRESPLGEVPGPRQNTQAAPDSASTVAQRFPGPAADAPGRPLDPFPTDQGAGETVAPDAEWNVVGMGRKSEPNSASATVPEAFRDVYEAGAKAYRDQLAVMVVGNRPTRQIANPYSEGSRMGQMWRRGYAAAEEQIRLERMKRPIVNTNDETGNKMVGPAEGSGTRAVSVQPNVAQGLQERPGAPRPAKPLPGGGTDVAGGTDREPGVQGSASGRQNAGQGNAGGVGPVAQKAAKAPKKGNGKANETLQQGFERLKSGHPNGLIAVRLGDFLEFFGEDAEKAGRILKLPITQRSGLKMAGIPYHAVDRYIEILRRNGNVVHVADIPEGGNRREVVQSFDPIVSASSPTDMFDPAKNDLFSAPVPGATAGSPRQPQGTFGLPAIPPGVPQATPAGRMTVAMERMVPGFTTVARIEQRLRGIVDVARGLAEASPIRSGRMARRFAGQFAEPSRVIRVWDRMNLPVAAHEIAHALADAIFGTAASRGLRGIPLAAGRELVRIGRALYGNQMPVSGYAAEGWAELVADWITSEGIGQRAPAATAWLENTVLPAFPEVARAMREARAEIDVWRGMGARERMRAQTAPHDSKLARLRTELGRYVGREGLVEQFAPFEALSRRFRQVAGRDLAADEDPFLIASARRGQAGSILAYMADEGMIDPSGNRTGGRSLREALAPVTRGLRPDQVLARHQRAADFWSYLWARRAIERWGLDRNPGISLADAQYLRQTLETPDFQLAASRYYQWWDGVLDYLAASSPANRELVARIRAGSKDYVPLARMLDPNQTRPGEEARLSNALRRMRGSSLPVRMLDVQTLLTAESLIARAHRDQVMEAVFRLANQPGMGAMIEEVPRSQVQEVVNIERLRAQLEGMGVDTTGIPADTLLEYYTGADAPGGSDPIVARRVNGEVRWYYVRPDLYAALEGIQPARLPLVADLLLGVPARLFRLGTTGLRPAFSLFTNPVRDIQTFLMQSTAGVNPLRRVAQYFGALGDIVRSGMPGADATPYRDLFDRLGIMSGQPLGGDIGYARREARGLFHGRVFKRVTAPVETLRELLSFSEAAPRIAELRLRAQEMGWAPGQPLTPAQAIQLTLAAKRVTTDFSASGSYARLWSQAVPFLNASIQGTRGFLRAMRERPLQATFYGVSMFTLPALWTWWHNKDEEWYQALPWRERYLYWNVPNENGQVYQIPRPPEWNNAFAVIPEALMDAAYRDNPDAVKAAFGHIFATTNPFDLPVLARIAWEQARNRVDFFDRPIVPRAQVDLRPGEQVGPYTSWLATSLGKAFPETISPRRVDHLLRGVGGGTASDTLSAIEQMAGLKAGALRSEPSETPVVGRALRRGGQFSAVNRQLADLYDLHYYWQARARNKELAPELAAYARYVDDQIQMVKFGQRVAEQTDDLKARQSLYRDLTRQAESMLADAKRLKRLPAQQ